MESAGLGLFMVSASVFTILLYHRRARMLDKCCAVLAGTAGGYFFDCPPDNRLLGCAGIDAAQFRAFVATGATDTEVIAWIGQQSKVKDRAAVIDWNNKLRPDPGLARGSVTPPLADAGDGAEPCVAGTDCGAVVNPHALCAAGNIRRVSG